MFESGLFLYLKYFFLTGCVAPGNDTDSGYYSSAIPPVWE